MRLLVLSKNMVPEFHFRQCLFSAQVKARLMYVLCSVRRHMCVLCCKLFAQRQNLQDFRFPQLFAAQVSADSPL
jgi:hypothetical protein